MAVVLTTEPNLRVSAYNCVEFLLTQDDGGTPPVEKSLIYQLAVDSTDVTEIEVVPYRSGGVLLDFKKDLQPYVYTTKPTIDSTTVATDSNIVKPFTLSYGERELDTSDCSVTQSLGTTTSDYFVYNAALQYYGTDKLASVFVLSHRPRQNYTTPTGNDWLYIHNPGGGGGSSQTILAEGYKSDGTYVTDTATIGTGNVHIVPVGRGNGFFKTAFDAVDVVRYSILIYPSAPTIPTNPYVRQGGYNHLFDFEIECKLIDTWRELYWLEPLGGYAGLNFEVDGMGVNRNAQNLFLKGDCAPLYTVPTLKGNVSTATSKSRISLKRRMKYKEDAKWFIDGLFASNSHFIKAKTPDNRTVMARFLVDGGDVSFFNDNDFVDITISGLMSPDILAQNYE